MRYWVSAHSLGGLYMNVRRRRLVVPGSPAGGGRKIHPTPCRDSTRLCTHTITTGVPCTGARKNTEILRYNYYDTRVLWRYKVRLSCANASVYYGPVFLCTVRRWTNLFYTSVTHIIYIVILLSAIILDCIDICREKERESAPFLANAYMRVCHIDRCFRLTNSWPRP
jgi:hypothetical protein